MQSQSEESDNEDQDSSQSCSGSEECSSKFVLKDKKKVADNIAFKKYAKEKKGDDDQ